jgi:hypothetical protein
MLGVSLAGTFHNFIWYSVAVLDIIPQNRLMSFVLEAVRRNTGKITATILLLLLALYFYALVTYLVWPSQVTTRFINLQFTMEFCYSSFARKAVTISNSSRCSLTSAVVLHMLFDSTFAVLSDLLTVTILSFSCMMYMSDTEYYTRRSVHYADRAYACLPLLLLPTALNVLHSTVRVCEHSQ